jgi:hypothetical protein
MVSLAMVSCSLPGLVLPVDRLFVAWLVGEQLHARLIRKPTVPGLPRDLPQYSRFGEARDELARGGEAGPVLCCTSATHTMGASNSGLMTGWSLPRPGPGR